MERSNRTRTERATARFAGDTARLANAAEHHTKRHAAERRNAHTADHGDGAEGSAKRAGETGDDRSAASRAGGTRADRSRRTCANCTGPDVRPCSDSRSDCCGQGGRRHPRIYPTGRESQSGPREHFPENGKRRYPSHEPGHQQRAGRCQPVNQRYSGLPIPRRLAGFDLERRLSRAQRPRQRSVPHQRHHPARRRLRLCAVPRNQLHRQSSAADRCAAGAIRPAQHRDPGHHLEGFHHQPEQRFGRCLWWHLRHGHADVRIWRQGRPDRIFLCRPRVFEQSRPRKSNR
jgi:hypothetical protein